MKSNITKGYGVNIKSLAEANAAKRPETDAVPSPYVSRKLDPECSGDGVRLGWEAM